MNVTDRIDALQNYGVNLETATIYIGGEIDANIDIALRMKIDMIKSYFKFEGEHLNHINLILSSPGGDAASILAIKDMYDTLLADGIKVNVLTEGLCYSAATLIIALATGKRLATKNTRFLTHELQIQPGGDSATFTQSKAFQKELSFIQDEVYACYTGLTLRAKNLPIDVESKHYIDELKKWEKRCTDETYFSAEVAKELGLIDEII